MGFFAALGRLLRPHSLPDEAHARLLDAWGLSDEAPPEHHPANASPRNAAPVITSSYDRDQWRRKLKTLLERLPDSQSQWSDFAADATALSLEPKWVRQAYREEFTLLLRRAVADRTITRQEHDNLELARTLLGLSESEATDLLNQVIAEAESFFGNSIDRGPATP